MAVVTSDLLASVLTAARATFNEGFPAALGQQPLLNLVLDKKAIDSAGHQGLEHGWLGTVPKMSRWGGSLEPGGVNAYSYTLTNYLHTASFEVDRIALERDQLGLIPPLTNRLLQEAARYPFEILINLINAGAGTTLGACFDGVAMFANRTLGDSGTIDNTQASAGTSVANFRTDIQTARSTMMAFKDDKGRTKNIVPNVILIHPNNSMIAWEALMTGPGAPEPGLVATAGAPGGIPSWSARGWTVIECADLTDTDGRYFFHVSPGMAPFIYQVETPTTLEGITSPNSDSAVLLEKFTYKARGSFNVGFGDPTLAVLIT